jgi:hypothetical protein
LRLAVLRGLGNRHLRLGFAAFVLELVEVALPLSEGRYLAVGIVVVCGGNGERVLANSRRRYIGYTYHFYRHHAH